MSGKYRDLNNAVEIESTALEFSRSIKLYHSIREHRDYSLIAAHRKSSPSGDLDQEILVVDVSCDGVPPSNPFGIEYTERLAICIPKDQQRLIEVLALRQDFPLLMHQNAVPPDSPPSLCLYQEPPRSVSRTWTAPHFLMRIQHWLERSSRGSLHTADQPVEHLFFASPFELVLPWNFDVLREDPSMRFWVNSALKRPGGGSTYFLVGSSTEKPERTASVVCLTLPAVVHGRIENDFGTLGQIADALTMKGIDFLNTLTSAVHSRVGTGLEESEDDPHSVLLLNIPITRAEGEPPSSELHKAYFLDRGILKLGDAIGVLCKLVHGTATRYYKEPITGFLAPPAKTEWRGLDVCPMEVLRSLDRPAARFQSGFADDGPIGTLIGAGALGSALLNMWTRSGWGEWSIIDNDHIKPHNLVRHQADASQVGASKAEAAADLVRRIMRGATISTAIHSDACEFSDQRIVETLQTSKLVVDASTTLDYPRLASTREDIGRHCSVFVTPSANTSVLLLEDSARKHRLRTLEAQYYRAILSEEWGRNHLEGSLGTYWSGASCRDISIVMPYSDILGHAAILAAQVPRLTSSSGAAIRLWCKDPVSGSVAAHSIEVREESCIPFDGLSLFIDDGVRDKMSALRMQQLPNETGGILLGYHDFNVNSLVVVDALPAPRDSKATNGSFERGLDGVVVAVAEAGRRTAGIVGYIGEWHSHPHGYSAAPSGDDKLQLAYLTLGLAMEGLPAAMLIIADNDLCVLQGFAK